MTKAAIFQDAMFHDEDKAREALEAELWPDGPVCRHCGNADPEQDRQGRGQEALAPSRPVLLRRVQEPVHRDGRHRWSGQKSL